MKLQELIGQHEATALLQRMLESKRVPHALLFHGPEGVGKATVARAFAAHLLCEHGNACGKCHGCTLLASDAHPDFVTVRREPKKGSKSGAGSSQDADDSEPSELKEPESRGLSYFIKVDQIRDVAHWASLAPRAGARRVFVIDPADRMNAEAQNALLKTLEEPPGRAVLILITACAHLLLPTVRSRSVSVNFGPVRTADLARRLRERGMAKDEAEARAALAGGCPGLALQLDVEDRRAQREQVVKILETMATADRRVLGEIPSAAAALAGKDNESLLKSLDLLEVLLRDAARAEIGSDDRLVHVDLASRLRRIGGRLGALRAARLIESIERVRGYLRFNTNRSLIAESLLAAVAGGPLP